MTSRILGVVREQVLAALFGAGNAMDAYNVAFRIPNLVRDLFAEGAMSAAFVPTFTRHLTTEGKDAAWRLGNHVINALHRHHRRPRRARDHLRGAAGHGASPASTASVPGKLELTVLLTRHHAALPHVRGGRRGGHGHAELAAPVLHPGVVAGDVQRGDDRLRVRARAADARGSACPPIAAIAIGTLVGGVAQLALQWPLLRREGFRYRPMLDWQRRGPAARARAHGAGHHRRSPPRRSTCS